MNKIDHPAFKKAYNGKLAGVIIGAILTAIALAMFVGGYYWNQTKMYEAIPFGQAYNEQRLEDDIYVYVEVSTEPYEFAYYDDGPSYYYISDGDEIYIMKAVESNYEEIVAGIDSDGYYDLVGVIEKIDDEDAIKFAIEAYNEGETDPDKIITREDFDSYFAGVAINPNGGTEFSSNLYLGGVFVGIFALILLIAAGLELYHYNKALNGLSEYQAQYITNELYSPQTVYIKKCRVFLTSTCIVSLGNRLEIVPYANILWAYRYDQRTNMVPTLTNMKVMKKDFSTVSIADMPGAARGKEEVLNQIFATISARNPEVLLGYTPQNQTYVNQLRTQQTFQNRAM
nr:hypothetical protein [uncultured Butyrivibrio sp.]